MRTRAERLQDRRDDAEHYLNEFRRLLSPSEVRAQERKIAKLQAKIDELEMKRAD